MPVGHAHTRDPAFLDENLLNSRISEDFTARLLDLRDNVIGDAPGTSHRVVATMKIVPGDHRLGEKCRLPGRQSNVTPLTAERGDEIGIVGEFSEHLVGAAVKVLWPAPLENRLGELALPGAESARHTDVAKRAG